jgi:molybdopterin/thiamine biosynthesis adenylyltransferase
VSVDERYSRQRRLPEVGDAGQARLAQAALTVVGSDGAIIEAEYLHRAGVERVELLPGGEPEPFSHEQAFRFAASRRIGVGAWRALAKIRRTLGMEEA